jgi:CheY-like chemotaxis protein
MSVVLFCSNRPLDRDLQNTVLFRSGLQREFVKSTTEVAARLAAGGVALVCLHREVAGVEALIKAIRRSPTLKRTSIAVISEDDFDPSEVDVLDAGANAILRLPPSDDFDSRVSQLIAVPPRRDVRLPVRLEVVAHSGFGSTVPVVALNLSATGVLIESNRPLNMGDEVSLSLRFEASGALFSANAHITRTAGANRYGARFISILEGEEALKTFLATAALA